jgi:hypothetical protein
LTEFEVIVTIENEVLRALIDIEDNAVVMRKLFAMINATSKMAPYVRTTLQREYEELCVNFETVQEQVKALLDE